MIVFLLFVSTAFAVPSIDEGLKSSKALLALFQDFMESNDVSYPAAEASARLRVFRKHLQMIQEINSEDLGWTAGINKFTAMTEAEFENLNGFNGTAVRGNAADEAAPLVTPSSSTVDWRSKGAVSSVKDQGNSMACWTYSSVACLEGVYKIMTGRMVEFADQELMDCVYEGTGQSGNNGGFMWDAYNWMKRHQRIAHKSRYPSTGRDSYCRNRNLANALQGYSVTGYKFHPKHESGLVGAISVSPVAVAFQATYYGSSYRSGLYYDRRCSTRPNHAVTAVGYRPDAIIIKNSYGQRWGVNGYAYFRRGWHGCGLYTSTLTVSLRRSSGEEE